MQYTVQTEVTLVRYSLA